MPAPHRQTYSHIPFLFHGGIKAEQTMECTISVDALTNIGIDLLVLSGEMFFVQSQLQTTTRSNENPDAPTAFCLAAGCFCDSNVLSALFHFQPTSQLTPAQKGIYGVVLCITCQPGSDQMQPRANT